MQGMRQGEQARQVARFRFVMDTTRRYPNIEITNSTDRLGGSKLCACNRVISMNKDRCLACKESGRIGRVVKALARAVGLGA